MTFLRCTAQIHISKVLTRQQAERCAHHVLNTKLATENEVASITEEGSSLASSLLQFLTRQGVADMLLESLNSEG